MYQHIVLLRLIGIDADFHARIANYVQRMPVELLYVRSYAFCANEASRSAGYDWAVLSSFDSSEDHDRYQISDIHQEMKAYMTPFIEDLVVFDGYTA